jgi:hypothetical protein
MRPSNTSILSVSLLISGSIALSGCGRGATTVSYRQAGICKAYDTASGPVRARSDEAFAIFKIEAVDNTKPSESFDFDPTHLSSTRASDQDVAADYSDRGENRDPGHQQKNFLTRGARLENGPVLQESLNFGGSDRLLPYVRPVGGRSKGGWPGWVPRRKLQPLGTVSFCRWTSRDVLRLGSIDRAIFSLSCKLRTLG